MVSTPRESVWILSVLSAECKTYYGTLTSWSSKAAVIAGADWPATGWHEGMPILVRRDGPHPGAQLSLVEAHGGWRYQRVATDTPTGRLAFLEARHRAHVEDRVQAVKETGMGAEPKKLRYRLLHRHPDRPRSTPHHDHIRCRLAVGGPARRRVHPARRDPATLLG
jgi:hypothetical protein